MNVKKILTVVSLAASFVAPITANSAQINSMFTVGINTAQDQDADRILRFNATTGSYDVVTSGNFQVGDVFQAILRFDSVNSNTISDSLPSPYALFAYSEVKINSITPNSSFGGYDVTFAPANINLSGGAMIALYERTSGSATNPFTSAPNAGISYIQTLTSIATFGLGDTDDFWTASIPVLIEGLDNPLGSGQNPSGVFGLSVLTNPGMLPIQSNGIQSGATGTYHDVIGDASAFPRETGVNTGWLVSTNTNVSFNVPEPTELALMGIGLIGMSLGRRKKA